MDAFFFGPNLAQALGAMQRPDYRDLKRGIAGSDIVTLPSGVQMVLNESEELMHVRYANGTELVSTENAFGKAVMIKTTEGHFAFRRNEGLWFFVD